MLAQAFHKGLIATSGQEEVLVNLLGKVDSAMTATYSKEYKALKYLDQNYKDLLTFKDGIAVAEKGGKETPLIPALYALHTYNQNEIDLFDKQIAFLESIMLNEGDQFYWNYKDGVERFDLQGPWVSGISQGIIASAFVRKYKESGDEKYLNIAKGAVAYCLDKKNGLLTEMGDGFWVEEYPSGIGKGVLNGFIFFLIALGELTSLGFFIEEYEKGIKTLIKELPSFHKGNYILYGKYISDLGNENYDRIHYHQLEALYKLTSISGFYTLKDYWGKTSVTLFD